MSNLDKRNNIDNGKEVETGMINKVKKATSALALTIALGTTPANAAKIVNDLKTYEDACLESVAGEKVTILVSEDFYRKHRDEILNKIPEEDTCEIKGYDKKKGFVEFPVVEKNGKRYFQITFKPVEWDLDASDIVREKERQVREKERQVREKGYLLYLQEKILYLLNNNLAKEEAISLLKEVNNELKLGSLRGNKYAKNIKLGLETIKLKYGNDKVINEYIDSILEKLHLN